MNAQLHPASHSLHNAADFLEQARERIAAGAPANDPGIAQLLDFAKRKLWQGEQELLGHRFAFDLD